MIEVQPENVYSGSIVAGEIHVRAWAPDMPEPGAHVAFAGYDWLVTRCNVPTPGGRNCYIALRTVATQDATDEIANRDAFAAKLTRALNRGRANGYLIGVDEVAWALEHMDAHDTTEGEKP